MAGPAEIGAWLGLANALCLFVTSSVRQRRLDYADVAPAEKGGNLRRGDAGQPGERG